MPEETGKRRTNRYVVGGTILGVLCLLAGIVWWKLPAIACYGVKYEWSREYSISTLKWIGPRAGGAVFKYEENFGEGEKWNEWVELLKFIIKNVETRHDTSRFVYSFEDVNAKNSYGWTPLHEAAYWGNLDIAKLLLERGADVNAKSSVGNTPLYWAASRNNLDIAKLLIENGADVNAKDLNGMTPLHWAAHRGNLDIAKLLIENGADVNAKDSDGKTPLDRSASTNITALLRKHGAKTGAELKATNPASRPSP